MTMRWIEERSTLGQERFSAEQQTRFDKARALLPACYSEEFALCVDKDVSRRDVTKFPNCVKLNQLWTDNEDDPVNKQLHALVDQIPYCPAPVAAKSPNYLVFGVVALAALGLGYALAKA